MDLAFDPLDAGTLGDAFAFVRAANPFAQHTWGWDGGRFVDWRWGSNSRREAESPGWFARHGAVVSDGGDVAALAVSEEGRGDWCIITPFEAPALVDTILGRLIERSGDTGVSVTFSDDAEWLRRICGRRGLTEDPATGHEWEFDLESSVEPGVLPEGFSIGALGDDRDADYAGISGCLQRAFGHDRDARPVLRNLESNPMFRPDLSIVARSPGGGVAAYCRGTADPGSGVCGIDPVCTDPGFQRLGLGAEVVRACFRAQRRLGGRWCYIGSAPEPAPGTRLYRSLGPSAVTTMGTWSLPSG